MLVSIDILIKNAICVSHNGTEPADVAIKDDIIVAIGHLDNVDATEVIDATGLHLLPGVIDTQVHFREPGAETKEDLESGSRAAVMGGVTAVFEMPNTSPATTTAKALADKVKRGTNRMWCDFAFYMGASAKNAKRLDKLERLPGCCGVKIFMGSSTGDLLVSDDQMLADILSNGTRRIAIHAEDEDRLLERKSLSEDGGVAQHPVWRDKDTAYKATDRILDLARRTGRRIHVLHVTTEDEMALLAAYKDVATVEVTPQHLILSAPECYAQLGTYAQMNPPIRDEKERIGLWKALSVGIVDVLGSDHAPHEKEMKDLPYPQSPSGMPGVQTMLPLMLDQVNKGVLSIERLMDLTSAGPARVFNIAGKGRLAVGYDADITLVDLKKKWTIDEDWLQSKCGWSPFTGRQITGKPVGTIVRGKKVMWYDELADEATGQPIRFQDTLNG
ncbi:dihydroorotase [Paremcibacter congregatus]|uniref:Dihydroorotase n=1 Tax=Paremcibacter congregatus TaxID=2043170 RepID=A0A2G4YTQ3_9PROT|nr:dihydroorotase [Paremcibacter congregatus]QDE26643.1 dihydroorotase [Paremcibacter congregatus]